MNTTTIKFTYLYIFQFVGKEIIKQLKKYKTKGKKKNPYLLSKIKQKKRKENTLLVNHVKKIKR